MTKEDVLARIDDDADRLRDLARDLWETPELGLHEEASAAALIQVLEGAGFHVETGVGGMPTAFVASSGEGAPRVGILGEYDALPGLSQRVSAERDPIEPGGPGHGCGHNLFGTAGVGAAVALAGAIDAGELSGTVRFYGCPAEETLVGKVFMARDGAFDDLDAAVTWHPSDLTRPQLGSSLALDSVQFTFHGTSAHAAVAPEAGRSALDAVQLLNTGVEYLREHVPEEARIHYAITDGGRAPNVVPDVATVWYYVRAPTRPSVERIGDRLADVAEGAALMTGTTVERRYVTGCYELLPNETVAAVIWENIEAVPPPDYDGEDRAFAAELQDTFDEGKLEALREKVPPAVAEAIEGEALYAEPIEAYDAGEVSGGSTEVGDVSWIAPTAQFRAATWPLGTPAHSWQAVAANGSFGLRGVPYAAKVLAGTVYDLLSDPDRLAAAREEFEAATGDRRYESPLPDDAEPPFDVTAGD